MEDVKQEKDEGFRKQQMPAEAVVQEHPESSVRWLARGTEYEGLMESPWSHRSAANHTYVHAGK